MKRLLVTSLSVLLFTTVTMGDWTPGEPAKWVQLPDLQTTGMDVLATSPRVLADDFLCTTTGPVTDVHLWGSWYRDQLPTNAAGVPDAAAVGFRLSIHRDIPADPTNPYSTPGELLWEKSFQPGEFAVRLYADDINEGWYDPAQGQYEVVGDHQAWQYNFFINPSDAFLQKGTTADPIVYWLDVEAFPVFEPGITRPLFGWKTSIDHWNDDAVWGDPSITPPLGWQELRYPSAHPYAGESIDLAFVLTPEPASLALLALGGILSLRRRRR